MIGINLRYQAIIFVNASDIAPTPENMIDLTQAFQDKGMIPGTFQEIALQGLSPSSVSRIELSSTSGEWAIQFASNQIKIAQNAIDPQGSNLEINAFCSDVGDFYGRILGKYSRKANRLAIITSFLLEDMPEPELDSTYRGLLNRPAFYEQNPPFEWDWRSVSLIPLEHWKADEKLNVITAIRRRQGQFAVQAELTKLDRIQLSFDINTPPQSKEYRFDLQDINDFYTKIAMFHTKLQKEVLDLIYEKPN